jgi:hypothetical protein
VGPLTVHTDRVAALVFSPALHRKVDEQGLRTWVGLSDGSRLMAEKLVVDGGAAQITTLGGQTWKAAPKDIFWLQPLGGRAVYLSQLRAAEYRHVPYLGLAWPYQTDRNVTGGWLRANGRLYPFGLGVHSAAHLVYELPGANESPLSPLGRGAGGEGKPSLSDPSNNPYKRFQAELAIDDSTAGGGSVRFLVIVDGRGKYASDTIRGGMPLVPVSVDIEGAKRLELVVDFADRADVLDHADWLNARLIR